MDIISDVSELAALGIMVTPDEVLNHYDPVQTTSSLPPGSTGLTCQRCQGEVLTAMVAYPLQIKGSGGVGHGKCLYVDTPYCPNCEQIPMEGRPLQVSEALAVESVQLTGRWWASKEFAGG